MEPSKPHIKPPLNRDNRQSNIRNDANAVIRDPEKMEEKLSQSSLSTIMAFLDDISTRQRAIERRLDKQQMAPRQQRQEVRQRKTPVIVAGRNGELLSRRHDDSINPFDLPDEFVSATNAEGFDLEWKTEMVHGQDRVTYQAKLAANGWRPVSNSRLPGRYAPEDDAGAIRFDGMILMERPMILTVEARHDEDRRAREQLQMKHESWGVNTKDPAIFDPNTPMAKSFTISPRSEVEMSDPAWQPALEIADGGE